MAYSYHSEKRRGIQHKIFKEAYFQMHHFGEFELSLNVRQLTGMLVILK